MRTAEPLKDNSEKLDPVTHAHLLRSHTKVTSPTRTVRVVEPPAMVLSTLC